MNALQELGFNKRYNELSPQELTAYNKFISRRYYLANPDKMKEKRRKRAEARGSKPRGGPKKTFQEWRREKYRSDPTFRTMVLRQNAESLRRRLARDPAYGVIKNMRSRLPQLIRSGKTCVSRTFKYSPAELKEHLERRFLAGMTWENYGSAWVVDHIIPVASFDITKPSEVSSCFSIFNLQPLWKPENCSKGAKVLQQAELLFCEHNG